MTTPLSVQISSPLSGKQYHRTALESSKREYPSEKLESFSSGDHLVASEGKALILSFIRFGARKVSVEGSKSLFQES